MEKILPSELVWKNKSNLLDLKISELDWKN